MTEDLHFIISMHFLVSNRVPQVRQVHFDFRLGPAERFDKVLDRPCVHALRHVPVLEFPEELETRIAGPAVDWNPEQLLMHVYKTSLFVPCLEFVGDAERHAEPHGGHVLGFGPFEKFEIRRHGAVVAVDFGVDFLRLHPSAWVEIVEGLLYYFAKIFEDAEGETGVNVVVGLCAMPPFFAANVVDEEVDVVGSAGTV